MVLDQSTMPTEEELQELFVEISGESTKEFYRLNVTSSEEPVGHTPADLAPEISTVSLQSAVQGASYNAPVIASGGNGTLTWNSVSGSFPPGLLMSESGLISGTPSLPGTYFFTVQVTDADGDTDTKSYIIEVFNGFTGWTETFEYANGTTEDTDDSDGVTWTASKVTSGGIFQVEDNELRVSDVEGLFRTSAIDISGGPVSISLDIEGEGGLDSSGEPIDWIRVYAIIDGNSQLISESLGVISAGTISASNLSGNSLVIEISTRTSVSSESYFFDNLSVTPE